MTSPLISAIRDRLADNELSSQELQQLLEIASEGGITPQEVGSILDAMESARGGPTPAARAQIWARLQQAGANDALQLLDQRRPSAWGRAEIAAELRARFAGTIDTASYSRSLDNYSWRMRELVDADAFQRGELRPRADITPEQQTQLTAMIEDLKKAQQEHLKHMRALRDVLAAMPEADRQILFASLGDSNHWRLNSLNRPVDKAYLHGLSEADQRLINDPLPQIPRDAGEGSTSFPGITFAAPTKWSFEPGRGLSLPQGTVVTSIDAAAAYNVRADGVTFPGIGVVHGGVRLQGGEPIVASGSRVETAGLTLEATSDDTRVRTSNGTVVAGPGVRVTSPIVDQRGLAPNAPEPVVPGGSPDSPPPSPRIEQRPVRFSMQNARLPDGVELRQGTGRMTAVSRDDRPAGVLDGSVQLDRGAQVIRRPTDKPLPITGHRGSEGQVTSGAAVYRDDKLIGFLGGTTVSIDGIRFRTASSDEISSYRFVPPAHFHLPRGAVVEQMPEGREVIIHGEDVHVGSGEGSAVLRSGAAVFKDGKIVELLSRAEADVSGVRVRSGVMPTTILSSIPEHMDITGRGTVAITRDRIDARGIGITLSGVNEGGLIPGGRAGEQDVRAAITVNRGTASITRRTSMSEPAGLLVETRGDVTVASGAWTFQERGREPVRQTDLGKTGPYIQVQSERGIHVIDTRPMWGSLDPKTDPGRVRRTSGIESPRFKTVQREADAVLAGRAISPGASGELVKQAQVTLAHFLDTHVPQTGVMDEATIEALRRFQRLSLVERTGTIDAATLLRLDQAAPAMNVPQVTRTSGRFGGALQAQVRTIMQGEARLSLGSTGELVRQAQLTMLESLGRPTDADGVFGSGTTALVREFQAANRLPTTGAIDQATMRKLAEITHSESHTGPAPRRKVMVMLALNTDVPDELKRFRQLAASRGAEAVIITGREATDGNQGERADVTQLRRYFAMAERGEIDFDWLVLSGHSGGSSTWGTHGSISYEDLRQWSRQYPRAAAQIEKLTLLNCYNVTRARAETMWPQMFPNISAMAGFMYSAPGRQAQTSDEHLLNSGQLMMQIPRGAVADRTTAERIGHGYRTDRNISVQNASMWVRYRDDAGDDSKGVFTLTRAAEYEMRRHGASDAMAIIPQHLIQNYENFYRAETEEFAEPPAQHHSGPLREYLNAVDTIMSEARSRLEALQRFQRRREAHQQQQQAIYERERAAGRDYQMVEMPTPPEFESTWGWERGVQEAEDRRHRVLFLIYHDHVRKFFDERYGRTIAAFNQLLASNGVNERFPSGQELRVMKRRDVIQMLGRVREAVGRLPQELRDRVFDSDPAWQIMRNSDPNETMAVSPQQFIERADQFLRTMEPNLLRAEWL